MIPASYMRGAPCLKKCDLLPLIKIPPPMPPIPPWTPVWTPVVHPPTRLNGDLVIHTSVFKEFMTVFVCGPLLCAFKL